MIRRWLAAAAMVLASVAAQAFEMDGFRSGMTLEEARAVTAAAGAGLTAFTETPVDASIGGQSVTYFNLQQIVQFCGGAGGQLFAVMEQSQAGTIADFVSAVSAAQDRYGTIATTTYLSIPGSSYSSISVSVPTDGDEAELMSFSQTGATPSVSRGWLAPAVCGPTAP